MIFTPSFCALLSLELDYIAIGPVYATGTKPTAKPVTLEYVRWAAANVNIPWFAIGGINLRTLDEVLAAGAERVCVVSAILNAPDVAKVCAEFPRKIQVGGRSFFGRIFSFTSKAMKLFLRFKRS